MPTRSLAHELVRRAPGRPPRSAELYTFASDFASALFPRLHAAAGITFPSPIYRDDPVRFQREILGVDPWDAQIRILEALRDHNRVSVKSGHKIGKSRLAGGAALWWYSSFDAARAVMTSTTARQVDEILWREVRMLYARAGMCLECVLRSKAEPYARIRRPCPHSSLLDGDLSDTARSGLRSADFREVVGFTAKQAEAVAGISGEAILYIVDEASGVPKQIYQAIEGNRAGGAKLLLLGNPTKNEGEFYDAFHSKARFYVTFTVSSESTPNAVSGERLIPGLATREWIEEKKEEWGEKSPLYLVRVKGEFAEAEEGKIFNLHTIEVAEQRHSDTPAEGRLYIGVDPAGEAGQGDEIILCPRRGLRQLGFRAFRGLDAAGHLAQVLAMIAEHKLPRETPVVVVDREGSVGIKVYRALRAYAEEHPGTFEVVAVRASDRSLRQPELYDRMRDALAASLSSWLEAGGAIVEDAKLAKELHLWEWRQRADGRVKLYPDKDTARKLLGRSPDRYDALALSTWEPLSLREETAAPESGAAPASAAAAARAAAGPLDPYAAAAAWERR